MVDHVRAGREALVVPRESQQASRARYLPIAEHGLIGDLHTVALMPDGVGEVQDFMPPPVEMRQRIVTG